MAATPLKPDSSPKSINIDNRQNVTSTFQNSLKRFTTGDPNTLPSSPQQASPRTLGQRTSHLGSPNGRLPPRPPLPRSPSSMSLDARPSPPSLLRKASMNSIHGIGGVTPPRNSPSRASPGRSSSAQYRNGGSPLAEMEQEVERAPRHTAISIAHDYFQKDMELHRKEDDTRHADTIAILHDSCYGHRYSRPKTTKATLLTIVERPERIQASILGLSVAYVRLGERHSEGRFPLHPSQDPSTIQNTPFRIRKTTRKLSLSSQAVTNVHGVKWMEELKIMCNAAESRLALNGKELVRPDIPRGSGDEAPTPFHEGDLYLCAESLDAMEGAMGAVCEGVDAVFNGSASGKGPHRAFVTIRPPGHHCSAGYPSGFCWVNNVHIGISHAALTHGLTHAAIIDFDLHHGDGSQAIAWDHNTRAKAAGKNSLPWKKSSIGYFSLHDINSYPCEWGDVDKVKNASLCIENAHGQSIWNVHLQEWKSEAEFWNLYETKYSVLLEKTRNYLRNETERLRANPNGPKPKGAIFLSAGFDASEWESSGMQRHKVNVPTEFYARFTRDIVKIAAEEGTSVEGRVISVLEGGYSDRALYSGVLSHIGGLAGGAPMAIKQEPNHGGLGYEMGQKISTFNSGQSLTPEPEIGEVQEYDPLWWSLPRLEQLDMTVNGAPAPEPRAPREGPAPTYSSPTQSFIAKVVSPSARRSVSSMSVGGSPRVYSRPPTPPPPEVHWTVAAHELSKVLIPSDKQIGSCKSEDLNAEATRARKDRQSILKPPVENIEAELQTGPANPRMALRIRKPAKAIIENNEEEVHTKPRANRRKTVIGTTTLVDEKASSRNITPIFPPGPSYSRPTTQSSRRLSLISNGSAASDASSRQAIMTRAPSNGASSLFGRPSTSQSVRPESSMSSRGRPPPAVVVKKTRAPAKPRAEPAKAVRVRKTSPLNHTKPPASRDENTALESSSDAVPTDPTTTNPPSSEIDALTSDMQKVKISLVTKAQREAKVANLPKVTKEQKPAKEPTKRVPRATKRAPAKSPSVTTPSVEVTPETAAQALPASASAPVPPVKVEEPGLAESIWPPPHQVPSEPESVLPLQPSTPESSLPPHFAPHVQQPTEISLPPSSPAGPASTIPSPDSPSEKQPSSVSSITPDLGANIFIPYQPEGPTPNAVKPSQPLRFLPPNTNTPSPMKRADLPIFTSSSKINFAPNPNVSAPQQTPVSEQKTDIQPSHQEAAPLQDIDMWEVPETPGKH